MLDRIFDDDKGNKEFGRAIICFLCMDGLILILAWRLLVNNKGQDHVCP